MRGHGRSGGTPGQYTFNAMGRDLRALLGEVVRAPAIVSLDPLSIPDTEERDLDGILLNCESHQENASHTFTGLHFVSEQFHPLLARFHARPGRTAWWVNEPQVEHLRSAGVPAACMHQELESALAASHAAQQ